MKSSSRRQSQADETRDALIDTARSAFARQGFRRTSIDEIAAEAGLTKGAVYHHFRNKEAIFIACYEQQLQRMTAAVAAVPVYAEHPWQSAMNRCRAFLDFGRRRQEASITLQEAISVLGWSRWRALDQRYSMGLVQESIDGLVNAGLIDTDNPALVAQLVYGMLVTAAMEIAIAEDPRSTREQAMATLTGMLRGLRG